MCGKILYAKEYIESEVNKLKTIIEDMDVVPVVQIVRVGEDEASKKYINNKIKMSEKVGMISKVKVFESEVNQCDLIDYIHQLNKNDDIHGILVQLPLPKHISEDAVIDAIDFKKDVDCFTVKNVGKLVTSYEENVNPCTPNGIVELLKFYKIKISGKKVVIINRSNIVGKPLLHMMIKENATVSMCHSKTPKNVLNKEIESADIIITGVGIVDFISDLNTRPGQTIVDVSINFNEYGKLCGDIKKSDYNALIDKGCNITPVPGGVGQTTVLSLLKNTVKIAERNNI